MKLFSGIRYTSWLMAISLVAIPLPVAAQTNYQTMRSFGLPDTGTQPHTALLIGQDGALYGTTQMGGAANQGTVFRLNVDGSGYTVLHSFSTNYDGKNPVGALIQGSDGMLYGSTVYGGSNRCGTLFALTTNGESYAVLYNFDKTNFDGAHFPYGRLVQGSNGVLYGTTSFSATNSGPGTIFQINPDGSGFAILHALAINNSEGMNPGGLILGQDGALYGVSQKVGTTNGGVFQMTTVGNSFVVWTNLPSSGQRAHMNALCQGTNGLLYGTVCYNTNGETIFSIGTDGSGYTVLHTFATDGVDGQNPDTQLLVGQDGALYGTTVAGGTNGAGTLFKINGDGSNYTVLYHFKTNNVDGRWPEDSLVQGSDGTLYGTTLRGGFSDDGTVYSINTDGTGYRQLYQFNSFSSEGWMPSGSLAPDGSGALYGVTHRGGSGNYGTLFKIGLDGNGYSILRPFGGVGDGQWPSGQLLLGQDLAWYGTTYTGGSNGFGTVFKINGDGSGYTQLYCFSGTNDGDVPYDALVQNSSGLLFGVTACGGTNGAGVVFSLNTNGTAFEVLHTFLTNGVDGTGPAGGLLLGDDGALYGATESGGTNNAGSLFKLDADGSAYAILHTFSTNNGDGINPEAGLLQGRNGVLYGTTQLGGTQAAGTVFTLNPDGSGYAILQSLSSTLTNSLTFRRGAGALIQASRDTLYGTVYEGGGSNVYGGFIFQIGTNGSGFSTIHTFGTNSADGANPSGSLVLAGTSWYGSTEFGGDLGAGSLYSLTVIPPGFTLQPLSQAVLAGGSAIFNAAVSGSPADYQWFFNGTPLPGATTLDFALTSVVRTNAGVYTMTASNAAGIVSSSNAVLTVYVPQVLGLPQLLPGGIVQISSTYADGYPLTAGDLSRFEVQVSSNLLDWVTLNPTLTVSNGVMFVTDAPGSGVPVRFYRVLENP